MKWAHSWNEEIWQFSQVRKYPRINSYRALPLITVTYPQARPKCLILRSFIHICTFSDEKWNSMLNTKLLWALKSIREDWIEQQNFHRFVCFPLRILQGYVCLLYGIRPVEYVGSFLCLNQPSSLRVSKICQELD